MHKKKTRKDSYGYLRTNLAQTTKIIFFLNQLVQSTARYFNQFCLSNPPEMEFKEFEPRFKSAKPRFKLITGLNLETFDTILSGTNHI